MVKVRNQQAHSPVRFSFKWANEYLTSNGGSEDHHQPMRTYLALLIFYFSHTLKQNNLK